MAENGRSCSNPLTSCKVHTVTMRRLVNGRSKTFDTLFAEQRGPDDHIVRLNPSYRLLSPNFDLLFSRTKLSQPAALPQVLCWRKQPVSK